MMVGCDVGEAYLRYRYKSTRTGYASANYHAHTGRFTALGYSYHPQYPKEKAKIQPNIPVLPRRKGRNKYNHSAARKFLRKQHKILTCLYRCRVPSIFSSSYPMELGCPPHLSHSVTMGRRPQFPWQRGGDPTRSLS